MSVLTDYFRAPDRVAVEQQLQETAVSPIDAAGFDGVPLKGVDDAVVLGKLVAAITGIGWRPGITGSKPVYPPPATAPQSPAGWKDLSPDSPWVTGPWVTELGDQARRALASLESERVPEVAARWITAEELSGRMDQVSAEEIIGVLQALAQRAEQAGDRLYCWTSL